VTSDSAMQIPWMTARTLLAVAFLAMSWVGRALATEAAPLSPQTTFFHANALYKDGQYEAAAKEYEQLLQSGLESGNLYFNLGNAYFKAGDRGKAILAYERARRLIPNDPDVDANLTYAQTLTGASPCLPALWQRLAFPLAQRMATSRLVWVAAASYTLFFFAWATYQLWPRRPRWLVYTVAALAVCVVTMATSLAAQLLSDDWQRQAVVVASGDTPARFEPAATGTVHFVLKEGSRVRVTDTREGWLQVARCDGRRGWIEQRAAADL
jgi:tetratricopeptide (TPR) repeat protein